MKKIESNLHKLPIFMWADSIEDSAMEQAINLANHPCIVNRVVLAPDCHCGYGMPIGGVIAVENAVIPNAVGVDIGCGMSALKTNIDIESLDRPTLEKIISGIQAVVPVDKKHHSVAQSHWVLDDRDRWESTIVCKEEYENAKYQLGTMGGGNHFIEVQVGDDNNVYIMFHSGSRNLGYKVGKYYNDLAVQLCTMWKHEEVVANSLAFLPKGSKEFDNYINEMNLCLDFAKANHELMHEKVSAVLADIFPKFGVNGVFFTRHNYADIEHHDGRNLLIHRKGAIRARAGEKCLIPGSQGTASYIVEGLGNPVSFCSASHGSGRKMSRAKAKENLSLANEQARMAGIVHNIHSVDQLDEAPSAYKDIEEVIMQESDLVKPLVRLKPLAVVKG